MFSQGESFFYVLKNNGISPTPTGGTHWLKFLPNHVYCFLPSFEVDNGEIHMCNQMPDYIKDYYFSIQINQVKNFIFEKKYCNFF